MNRYAKLTFAAAALALGALSALPASAADIVVKLAGKSPAQISTEVRTAAKTICKEDVARWTQIDMNSCIDFVFNDAIAQLPPTIVIPTR
jgi:hypothetical protein